MMIGQQPRSVVIEELTGSGLNDLAIACAGSHQIEVVHEPYNFWDEIIYSAGAGTSSVAAGDLDGDQDLDLAIATAGTSQIPSDRVITTFNKGDGTFTAPASLVVGQRPRAVVAGDLDGDDDLDLAVANQDDDELAVLLNNGTGVFTATTSLAAGQGPRSLAVGDLDNDGDLDLAVASAPASSSSTGSVTVYLNQGDGSFVPVTSYQSQGRPHAIDVGDFDADGNDDLAVATDQGDQGSVDVLFVACR